MCSFYFFFSCDYLSIFDMYYMNETIKYFRSVKHSPDFFRSESSNIFIMLCHGGMLNSYDFQINFSITST